MAHGRELVGPSGAEIHDGDGTRFLGRSQDEATSREDSQRGSEDEEAGAGLKGSPGLLDPGAGHGFSEEDDIGLENPSAPQAGRDPELGMDRVRKLRVPIGSWTVCSWSAVRVEVVEARLDDVSPGGRMAGHAPNPGERSVQLHDVAASGGVVKTVDVLGDDSPDHAQRLEARQG